ncbi:MAG: hypothetical protein GC182_19960 [Rhodopseudomonas sp.]|nr:hypothetical protein [Rhodopseudomonas sp.]
MALGLPALALLLAACGTSGSGGSSGGSSFLNKINIFAEKKTQAMTDSGNAAAAIADNDDIDCPGVAVRTGAATLSIGKTPGDVDVSALDLRYQGTILRTARECHITAGVMNMKVGVEGRIITGPAGGPGAVDVPLRMAVVQEGVEPKTIASKLAIVPVTITDTVDRVTFTHVESDVIFPMPVRPSDIDSYVVYVGFDPLALKEKKKPAPVRKRSHKPRPAARTQ